MIGMKRMSVIMKVCLMIAFLNGEVREIDHFLTDSCFNSVLGNKYRQFISLYID